MISFSRGDAKKFAQICLIHIHLIHIHLHQTGSNLFRCCSSELTKWKQSVDYKIYLNEVRLTVLVSEVVRRLKKKKKSNQQRQGLSNRLSYNCFYFPEIKSITYNGHFIYSRGLIGMWQSYGLQMSTCF